MSDCDAVAVIPARGGSKRIANKNRRKFLGVPIIRRVANALSDISGISRVVVTTDDSTIASAVSDLCEVIDRPSSLADDHTPTWPVIVHAIKELGLTLATDQIVTCVYPTAVLLGAETLRQALESAHSHPESYTFPVVQYGFPPQRAVVIGPHGRTEMLHPGEFFARSQDLTPIFHDAGQFYVANVATWLTKDRFFDGGVPLVVSELDAQDIDTESDWALAELKFRLREVGA